MRLLALLALAVAPWDGSAWSRMGTGVDDTVFALAVAPDGSLYAGGAFTAAGGVQATRVARRDGTGWSALGEGLPEFVRSLVVAPDGTPYAAIEAPSETLFLAGRVARWTGGTWQARGEDFDFPVFALATTPGGTLYAAGWFTTSPLGGALDAGVSLAVAPDGSLYAAGRFTVDTAPTYGVGRWDGSAWSLLGATDNDVFAVAFDANADLVLGGSFETAGGVASPHIALYDAPAPVTDFTFTQPAMGDSYRVGAWLKSIWNSPEPSTARVVLTLRRGSADPIEVYRGSNLQIPDFGAARYLIPEGTLAGDDYRFRIQDETDPATFAVSDAFSITDQGASFTLTAPVGGDAIALGSTRLVTWRRPAALPGGHVVLALADKATGATGASVTTANDGQRRRGAVRFPREPGRPLQAHDHERPVTELHREHRDAHARRRRHDEPGGRRGLRRGRPALRPLAVADAGRPLGHRPPSAQAIGPAADGTCRLDAQRRPLPDDRPHRPRAGRRLLRPRARDEWRRAVLGQE